MDVERRLAWPNSSNVQNLGLEHQLLKASRVLCFTNQLIHSTQANGVGQQPPIQRPRFLQSSSQKRCRQHRKLDSIIASRPCRRINLLPLQQLGVGERNVSPRLEGKHRYATSKSSTTEVSAATFSLLELLGHPPARFILQVVPQEVHARPEPLMQVPAPSAHQRFVRGPASSPTAHCNSNAHVSHHVFCVLQLDRQPVVSVAQDLGLQSFHLPFSQ
jgi:hypothetical protein